MLQLMKAGFTPKEIESAVFDLMEDDDSFERALRRKATVLHRHRVELDSKLSTLEYLEVAAASATDDRMYAVMEVALTQSAERAVRAATSAVQVAEADGELVRRGMRGLVYAVLGALRGKDASAEGVPAEAEGHGIAPLVAGWAHTVVELLASDEAPASPAAQRLVRGMTRAIAGEGVGESTGCARDTFAAHALAAFPSESENGVPIELVFGEGSFAFLAKAARAASSECGSANQVCT